MGRQTASGLQICCLGLCCRLPGQASLCERIERHRPCLCSSRSERFQLHSTHVSSLVACTVRHTAQQTERRACVSVSRTLLARARMMLWSILGRLLTDVRPVHGVVLLHLHGLHLLLDSVHDASEVF